MNESGIWKIRIRGTDKALAHVRLEYSEDGLRVYLQEGDTGGWVEEPEAFALLMGDYGAVERIA